LNREKTKKNNNNAVNNNPRSNRTENIANPPTKQNIKASEHSPFVIPGCDFESAETKVKEGHKTTVTTPALKKAKIKRP
jgi:hypothetical protein